MGHTHDTLESVSQSPAQNHRGDRAGRTSPLTLLLALTYVEERRALREMTGANFKEVAVEAARRIEMQVSRGMNEAQQLATTPFLHTAVTEANRTYEGKDAQQHPGHDQGLAAAVASAG